MTADLVDTAVYDDDMMNDIYRGISQNILIEMKKQKLSMSELGRLAGMDISHITRIINGKSRIGLTTLLRLSIVLHVPIGELIPIDTNLRKTNGQRFDEMTKELDLSGTNFLLGICADYGREWNRISKIK